MKKAIALMLAALVLLCLSGCGGKTDTVGTDAPVPAAETAGPVETADTAADRGAGESLADG